MADVSGITVSSEPKNLGPEYTRHCFLLLLQRVKTRCRTVAIYSMFDNCTATRGEGDRAALGCPREEPFTLISQPRPERQL